MCGRFAEAFEGRDCYSDAGWIVAGVWIIVGNEGCWFVTVVVWRRYWSGSTVSIYASLISGNEKTHPSELTGRSGSIVWVSGTGLIFSGCSYLTALID